MRDLGIPTDGEGLLLGRILDGLDVRLGLSRDQFQGLVVGDLGQIVASLNFISETPTMTLDLS